MTTTEKKHNDKNEISLEWRRTKIVATLGPACSKPTEIKALIEAGADVIRLNMSHGDHETHSKVFQRVRRVAKSLNKHIPILADLCGPKIRTGIFENDSIVLENGDKVTVTTREVIGSDGLIFSQYKNLHKDVAKGERILLDDGNLELKILSVKDRDIFCEVIYGGVLKNHKGMNLPDTVVSTRSFTNKDKIDAKLAVELGVDFIALSFVRDAADVKRLQRYLKKMHADIPIISKIEKPEAVDNIEEILDASYGIMVARGDLGIEVQPEKVPLIQQDLIAAARIKNKPVIVATQMMESMITHSRPTRAEIGDVANAALLSADAVMLSGETSVGKYPNMAISYMDRTLREMEAYQWRRGSFAEPPKFDTSKESNHFKQAIGHAVMTLADNLRLQGIIVPTNSGSTARVISAYRPTSLTISISPNAQVCRQLMLSWGVMPVLVAEKLTYHWHALCEAVARQQKGVKSGDNFLFVSGFNPDPTLNKPVLKLIRI
ncbi:MAG: pyruvate kinase [Gammaproteobacteria bacterium]|nr:pyruvate kinase [Gammaproteobacteria bacterium]